LEPLAGKCTYKNCFACKSPKMAVSRTAAIIVNHNSPLRASNVQSIHGSIPPLFSAKFWWGLVKNCLACGPYNLWKLPQMAISRTAAIIVNQNHPLRYFNVQLIHEGIFPIYSAKFWWSLVKNCLWVSQTPEIIQIGNQLIINCMFPDALIPNKNFRYAFFVSLNPAAQILSEPPPSPSYVQPFPSYRTIVLVRTCVSVNGNDNTRADLLIVPIAKVLQNGAKYEHAPCSTTCRKMLHVLDGKMLQKQTKVGEQHVFKQSNMSQNCANFQFLHNICAIYITHTVRPCLI